MRESDKLDFLTVMANSVHDMKNSLSSITNTIEKLSEQDDLGRTQQTSLDILTFESRRLNNTFIQFLALYKIENKKYFANVEEHNVYECLNEAALDNDAIIEQKSILIELQCDEALEWYFDRMLILSIIGSCINNACRYAKRKIILEAECCENKLIIRVLDDGDGYPEYMLNRDDDEQTKLDLYKGHTGLGLYFAELVAGMHKNRGIKGYTSIDNHGINGGSRFSIYLP